MLRSGAINSWLSPRAASIFGLVWVVVAAVLLRPQAPWWGYVAGKPNELGIGYAATAAVMAAVPGLLLWQLSKPTPAAVIKHYGVTAAPVTTAEAAAAHRDLTDAASSIMPLIMMTGFPGFLASELLPRILLRAPAARLLCIVQAKFAAMARARLAELDAVHPNLHLLEQRRVYLVHGDIVTPGLGLPGATGSSSGAGDSESRADAGKPATTGSAALAADATSPTRGKSGRKRRSASASGAARSPDAAAASGSGSGAGAGSAVSRGQPSPRRASLPVSASGQPLSASYMGSASSSAAGTGTGGGVPVDEDVQAAIALRVIEIFHVAAVYDLSVSAALGDAVNVRGTRNVIAFAKRCPRLHCLHYVSTCYVSGKFAGGTWRERDLKAGQAFNNHYERTKYEAEVEVQAARESGLRVAIYRPAIVVGDASSGATQKFDGPYYVIQWILRQPRGFSIMPLVGDPDAATVNVVPRDYVVDAIAYLSAQDSSVGRVFQLADPAPMTVRELLDELAKDTGHRIVCVPLPLAVAKAALRFVPGVAAFMRIPASALDYFVHPVRKYDSADTQAALARSGITTKPLREYLPRLIDFVRNHPDVGAVAMV